MCWRDSVLNAFRIHRQAGWLCSHALCQGVADDLCPAWDAHSELQRRKAAAYVRAGGKGMQRS
jgi:hypothetical protein